jgi:hypothetical protein
MARKLAHHQGRRKKRKKNAVSGEESHGLPENTETMFEVGHLCPWFSLECARPQF